MAYRLFALFALGTVCFAGNFEEEALGISRNIQESHLPFGTVLDPVYKSSTTTDLQAYSRCGDSAIWTGHWLAAESFRYAVTKTPDSLQAAKRALAGIALLVNVTGSSNLLARCLLPVDSPYSAGPLEEERQHGVYTGKLSGTTYNWIGNTSRDQYLGVFFGLSAAYKSIPDAAVRATISDLVTRLLNRLIGKAWMVVMPDGDISTVFWLRPDQTLALLQVGRQVNSVRFGKAYESARANATGLDVIMEFESLDPNGSYYKFNLDAITWFTLVRLEEKSSPKRDTYLEAYHVFRQTVAGHGNAWFNVVDLALAGPSTARDSETATLMLAWLQRPKRDVYVDLRGEYPACGDNRACDAVAVAERVPTDFLWQRSPFQLYGGGSGVIESAGIDFILPYWVARAYGLDLRGSGS